MSLLEQIIELLSRPPGSVIYHILTLFALQVVLALAITRRQRDPNDEAARRMTIAAGGTLIARLILLFVGLVVAQDPTRAREILPPLEQAIDTVTVILLVWGLVTFAYDRPRLADGVLLVSLIFAVVLFLFFLQEWQSRAIDITAAYIGTVQAYFWGVLQLAVLLVGAILLFIDRSSRLTLKPFIVSIVLVAHVAHFFNYPEPLPSGTDVAYWLRLGYLIAFPLWAVLAYRDSMRDMMTMAEAEQAQSEQLANNLRLSTAVISARFPQLRLEESLDMIAGLLETQFATIGLIDEKNPERIVFASSRPSVTRDSTHGWQINMNDHAAFRLAYEQQRGIDLLPRGVGARQVHELSQQFNIGPFGPVIIEPLVIDNRCQGFMVLAAAPSVQSWSDRDRAIIPGLSGFVSQALINIRRMESEVPYRATTPAPARPADRDPEKERLIIELAEARRQMAAAETRARQAEAAAVYIQQRVPGQPTTARPQVAQAAVNEVVENALEAILPIVRDNNLKLDLNLNPDLPLVAVKEAVLKQLIVSLLENACRASTEGGRVVVRAELDPTNGAKNRARNIKVAFSDSGPGIQPDDQSYVFDTQYYLQGGTPVAGLGDKSASLAVVQKLAQASGGDIGFETISGEGTTFTLQLPIAEVRPWSALKRKSNTEPVAGGPSKKGATEAKPAVVMSQETAVETDQ
jgi:signal transduction histidine kinase